ncbi:MAG: DUF2845 domain-containing protein [Gammaproteobacteria bacterium]
MYGLLIIKRSKMLSRLILTVLLGAPVMTIQAADHHMRCGTKLVSIGDTKAEVLLACGEPLLKETIAVQQETEHSEFHAENYPLLVKHGLIKRDGSVSAGSESSIAFPIDQWTYNIGAGKFLRILIFQGGRLAVIENGDRM